MKGLFGSDRYKGWTGRRSIYHDYFFSFSLDDKELAVPYTTPLAMFKAACPYDPFALTRESAMNVGSATISATTDICNVLAGN